MNLALTPGFPLAGERVDIIALHSNNEQGTPGPYYTIGDTVTVAGIVTVGTYTFAGEYTEVFIQDATAGIKIYADTIFATFAQGDSLTITGTIEQYKGMTEIVPTDWTVHSQGHLLPEPLVLNCSEVDHSFQNDHSEPNEGRLIRIEDVTLSGTWPSELALTDSTGSCRLYIDYDTGLQDLIPSYGAFSLIGILKQYDTSSPYTDGYEIVPRYIGDVMFPPGPKILSPPLESEISSSSVTITWETDTPSASIVSYGTTAKYELGAVIDTSEVTQHAVTLEELRPATIYHCRATSSNQEGSTTSGDHVFASGSGPSSTGEINVYFNLSVDTSLTSGVYAQGEVDLATRLIQRIEAAGYSIDACGYSFDLSSVADALIAAHHRGVRIRFIYENRQPYQEQVLRLIDAGIPVIDDSFGSNDGQGLMHNKFFIFDARDTTSAADDWVWTGSYNVTSDGTYKNAQNVVEIQDQALATCYTAEFNEMWGSSSETPDSLGSRFGANKRDDTPHLLQVNNTTIRQYMSPSDWTNQMIIDAVGSAELAIYFCILSFTRQDVAEAMRARRNSLPGFKVRGVFDSQEQDSWLSQWHNLSGGSGPSPWDPPADVWLDGEPGLLHHKYMIIDGYDPDSEPMVITGSHNWSLSADTKNDENTLIIQDPAVANLYLQEFAARYRAAGGSAPLIPRRGDVNLDNSVNILDIILLVNAILGLTELEPDQEWAADTNSDGSLNILDVIITVNIILGLGPLNLRHN